MKALHHRRSRVHRQHARRPAERRRRRGRDRRRLSRRAGASSSRARCARHGVELVEGDVLDDDAAATVARGMRHGVPPRRRTRTCATASSTRAAISSRTRSPPRSCSRRCAPPACTRIAFSSTGSVYGEPEVFPTPEDAPVPGADLALRRLEARRRRADPAPTRTATASPALVFRFVSILGERYTHGHVFDFCRACGAIPRACACSATAARRSRTSTSATASRRS